MARLAAVLASTLSLSVALVGCTDDTTAPRSVAAVPEGPAAAARR